MDTFSRVLHLTLVCAIRNKHPLLFYGFGMVSTIQMNNVFFVHLKPHHIRSPASMHHPGNAWSLFRRGMASDQRGFIHPLGFGEKKKILSPPQHSFFFQKRHLKVLVTPLGGLKQSTVHRKLNNTGH
jgi:hypothetical protein